MTGRLYLIPTVLAEGTADAMLAPVIGSTIGRLRYFLCENARTARRFVSELKVHTSIASLEFYVLDKDTTEDQLPSLFAPLLAGEDMGILSESGCPAIADPGSMAVNFAHKNNLTVVPLPGPSSLVLAVMASGLNGQCFGFQGYLPVDTRDIAAVLRSLERESAEKNQTQVFIETPYRNNKLLGHLLKNLHNETRLCIAANLTSADEYVRCKTVKDWKASPPALDKVPATFLFLAVGK